MARKPRSRQDDAASGQPAGGSTALVDEEAKPPELSQAGEQTVRSLASLVGRQIAREQSNGKDFPQTLSRPKEKKA